MDLLLQSLPENPTVAKYRQITDLVRSLIVKGDLKPGTRLPPIAVLAQQWDTNYFTVRHALSPLSNEGLIESSPGRGTFVRNQRSLLNSVAIYCGASLWKEGAFYQNLFYTLQSLLEKQNVRVRTFIDTRPASCKNTPLPELLKITEKRQVQGIIGPQLSPEEVSWLRKLNLPLSIFGLDGVRTNYEQLAGLALDRLVADGCKTVGTVSVTDDGLPPPELYSLFEELATARGLTTTERWCQQAVATADPESFGYGALKEIWAQQVRPDGLFIHHDWVCRGAITSILELGIPVPKSLRLVLYRNEGVKYLCPWTFPHVSLDINKVASVLIDFVEEQNRTGDLDLKAPFVPVLLVG